ncbi:hypothetical protein BASA50_000954 [Batrachochytrium salamandrivorans]|uniref:Pre-mRNA-splicing factor SYF2 n=1 Tax=Batrachochytrium salamandrivorans TaxID=1357716 RepID=A0ABQ8ESS5_9FUNG|nr:hypothetical protein BASA62_006956 [Batrachochytrium salamandrivorans]KAH6582251.1 hypothetical protein BASA60_002013 [Batrachochytrium salamandrivorans]KAH6586011.1 hypothetical protein BASA50_000954 [Batrachochytrium salamandrivorans]KAH6587410.1 hypothetical protein BASA61_006300 [Batrachochytrium salamandrivorans]KAH9275691.1 hypothetical protein BASA83_001991 [Batrachochytrium salamandrivorans]
MAGKRKRASVKPAKVVPGPDSKHKSDTPHSSIATEKDTQSETSPKKEPALYTSPPHAEADTEAETETAETQRPVSSTSATHHTATRDTSPTPPTKEEQLQEEDKASSPTPVTMQRKERPVQTEQKKRAKRQNDSLHPTPTSDTVDTNDATPEQDHQAVSSSTLNSDGVATEKDLSVADAAPLPMSNASRLARFASLKAMRAESLKLNRKDVHSEFVRSKVNPKEAIVQERKLREAQELQIKVTAEANHVDYERIKNLDYTIDDVERWEEKLQQKEARKDHGFTDYAQIAAKKYNKLIAEIKPDLTRYRKQAKAAAASATTSNVGPNSSGALTVVSGDAFYTSAHSLSYADPTAKPSDDAIDRLAKDIEKQRAQRGQFSRRRAFDEEDEVTYINERNMRFNKKISRAYDKYTADIKANFERGTAL